MTLHKDNRRKPEPQNRTQKLVLWAILGVAAALLLAAAVIAVVSGARLF